MSIQESLVVGLDIGTTKVCVVVGKEAEEGRVAILGVGHRSSTGMRKGAVINVDSTVEAIQEAVEDAELMADCEIRSIYMGIGCGQMKSFNSHGIVAIKNGEVRSGDVRRVMEAARTVAMPADRQILHCLPVGFAVDEHGGIRDPMGIRGVRLEVNCHIVTTPEATTSTLIKCAHRTGLSVADIVLEPLAGAEAALTRAERDMGVALVDVGGGTTDVLVYCNGSVRHTSVLGLGGSHVTADIAKILRTPVDPAAEHLKVQYGHALAAEVPDETLSVPALGGGEDREVSRQVLCGIIEKRVEEILELAKREIDKSGYGTSLTAGLVLAGGTARLPGLEQLASRIFDLPVRVGTPTGLEGLADLAGEPEYVTAVGLLLYGIRHGTAGETTLGAERGFGAVVHRMRGWLREFF